MAIGVYFRHAGFTPEKYDEAIRRLSAEGQGSPPGRLEHFALENDGEVEVFDVWESAEALDAWGPEGFVPVLLDLGVELHPPTILPLRNSIHG